MGIEYSADVLILVGVVEEVFRATLMVKVVMMMVISVFENAE